MSNTWDHYAVAFRMHLYHYAVRDLISWSMANDHKWFQSSGLNWIKKTHAACACWRRHEKTLRTFPKAVICGLGAMKIWRAFW